MKPSVRHIYAIEENNKLVLIFNQAKFYFHITEKYFTCFIALIWTWHFWQLRSSLEFINKLPWKLHCGFFFSIAYTLMQKKWYVMREKIDPHNQKVKHLRWPEKNVSLWKPLWLRHWLYILVLLVNQTKIRESLNFEHTVQTHCQWKKYWLLVFLSAYRMDISVMDHLPLYVT